MIPAFRRLATAATLTALAACGDFGPELDLDLDQISSEVTSTLGTDSITGYLSTDSEIVLNGVIYAAISCDGLTWRGERPFGMLRVTITADPASDCPRVRRRVAYRLSLLNLTPGRYRVEVIHDEPASAVRGRRTVFAGTIEVR